MSEAQLKYNALAASWGKLEKGELLETEVGEALHNLRGFFDLLTHWEKISTNPEENKMKTKIDTNKKGGQP